MQEIDSEDIQDELIYLEEKEFDHTSLFKDVFKPVLNELTDKSADKYDLTLALMKGSRKKPQNAHIDGNLCTLAFTVNRSGTLYASAEASQALFKKINDDAPDSQKTYVDPKQTKNLHMKQTPAGSMLIMSSIEHEGGGIFHKQPEDCSQTPNGFFVALSVSKKDE